MEYNTYPPDGDLGALVKCYWSLCISKEVPKGSQQVLSVGCMDMIFNLKPPHADGKEFFALFLDSEGNRLGLHSPN